MDKSVFFVSDLHLGSLYADARPDREAGFEAFVRSLAGRASHLFLLGDVFEFWMEYRHYIPKHHFGVLVAVSELRRSGAEIHYSSGNHDFNLGGFFQEALGIETHDRPFVRELQGKRVLLLHGDGMNPRDKAYRLVCRVLRHPLSNFAYKLLHPDLGMAIARAMGHLSRNGNVPRRLPEYEAEARRLLAPRHADVLVHGHVHAGFVKRVPEGINVNTGEWLEKMQYVEMAGGECFLKIYSPDNPRLMDSNPS